MKNPFKKSNSTILLIALVIALLVFFYVKNEPREKDRCYDDCFPFVGKLIDEKCHCAYNDQGWTRLGDIVEAHQSLPPESN